jgi:hypothetical protein
LRRFEAREDEELLARFVKEAWNAQRVAEKAPEPFVAAFTPERATARYYVQEFVEAPSPQDPAAVAPIERG